MLVPVHQRHDTANLVESRIGQRPHLVLRAVLPQLVFQTRFPDPNASAIDAGPVP